MKDIILFDLDGTLTDPKEGITNCVKYALESQNIYEQDEQKLLNFIGPPLIDSFMSFYGFSESEGQKLVEKYRERFSVIGIYENKIFDGVPDMLKTIKEKGKIICLATSKPLVFAKKILEHFDICKYFDVICGAELDGTNNYKHEVISQVITKLQNPGKDRIVMVGDRKQDIEGAKKIGITSVGVRFGYAGENELEQAGADYIVDSVKMLSKLILEI